jgi:hypothetical protein
VELVDPNSLILNLLWAEISSALKFVEVWGFRGDNFHYTDVQPNKKGTPHGESVNGIGWKRLGM